MIDKSQAQQEGYQVLDSTTQLSDQQAERIEQLKATLPGIVNGDGKVDINVLDGLLGQESIASRNQGYGLNFAGKGLARAMADEPTDRGLKVELGQSKDFDETGNIIIRGDNLDALKILRQNYYKAVKMIYIDPPYNTDSDNFVYKDSFSSSEAGLIEKFDLDVGAINFFDNIFGAKTHSSWLYAMYPRLKLARELLTDDGVIFISIDDNEQANLKILCDEIFGEDNFEGHIHWRRRHNQPNDATKMIGLVAEHILAYAKNTSVLKDHGVGKIELTGKFDNPDNDPRGDWASKPWKVGSDQSGSRYVIKTPTGKKYDEEWMGDENTFGRLLKDDRIVFPNNGKGAPRKKYYKSERMKEGQSATNWWAHDVFGSNQKANSETEQIFGIKNVFSNPKPTTLVRFLVDISNTKNSDIVLDFFAGSGTTAHTIMNLNKLDEGNRKFILVQWDEEIDKQKSSVAHQFCVDNGLPPIISSICIERVNRAGEKIRTPKLDVGYKVFSLADRPKLMDEGDLFKLEDPRATTNDKLYNMLAASGKPLHTTIEEVEPDLLYKADEAYYVLGECKADLKDQAQVFIDGYAEISLEKWLNTLGLDKSNVTILY